MMSFVQMSKNEVVKRQYAYKLKAYQSISLERRERCRNVKTMSIF